MMHRPLALMAKTIPEKKTAATTRTYFLMVSKLTYKTDAKNEINTVKVPMLNVKKTPPANAVERSSSRSIISLFGISKYPVLDSEFIAASKSLFDR